MTTFKLCAIAIITTLVLSHAAAAKDPVDASARTAADAMQRRVEAAPTGDTAKPKADGPPRGLYVFISSSIPPSALIEIAKDAARLRVPLILRGLAGESLQDTLKTMLPLTTAGAALEIDPLLFETYKIERVPAVIRTCGARGEGPYAAVYGIGPSQALPILHKTLPCES